MSPSPLPLTTRELSESAWHDFEKLFSRGNGWDFCWCMHFQRARCSAGSDGRLPRAERSVVNRQEKKKLVKIGRAHGVLVYAGREPIGWCQYGPKEELPRMDASRRYRGLALKDSSKKLWRITCFVVDKRYRRRGVAQVALKGALESIREKGGGIVEAYPLARCRPGTFGNQSTHGTASMFEKEGFRIVAPFGVTKHRTNVLMRRTV